MNSGNLVKGMPNSTNSDHTIIGASMGSTGPRPFPSLSYEYGSENPSSLAAIVILFMILGVK